jgi:hypothetical protein
MTLFMERINPSQLLVRITSFWRQNEYQNFVIAQIEQEYEHNMTQQIYISDECWSIIVTAKNIIYKCSFGYKMKAQMQIVWNYNKWFVRKPSPSVALAFIKTKWVNYGEIILISSLLINAYVTSLHHFSSLFC